MYNSCPIVRFGVDIEKAILFFYQVRNPEQCYPSELKHYAADRDAPESRAVIVAYVSDYFIRNRVQLQESAATSAHGWKVLAGHFFKQTERIFGDWPWPAGDYRGYVNVLPRRHPRHIRDKYFAVPIFSNRSALVTAHEMLHFLEYDYLERKFGLVSTGSRFWQFTENLNVLIENGPDWDPFSQGFVSQPYDDCRELFELMQSIWKKSHHLDDLVREIFFARNSQPVQL